MGDLKIFPASEVSLHTSRDDCWLLINGKVYDVTKFLEDHPGGEEVLLHASGLYDYWSTRACLIFAVPDMAASIVPRTSGIINNRPQSSGDATDAFENVGHSTAAVSMMESYLIGSVEGYVPPYVTSGEASSKPTSYAEANKEKQATFVDYLLPVLVLIFAFVAWYYLTFIIKDEEK